jgi:two-component system chemotaxis sensor kinase CheA
MDDLLAEFLNETVESLAELDVAIVRLEQTPDDEATLALIFRLVHTIKGTCGFLGLSRLERIAHAAENLLGQVRDRQRTADPDLVTVILTAIDRIKQIVAALAATGQEPGGDDVAVLQAIERISTGAPPSPSELPDLASPYAAEAATQQSPTFAGPDPTPSAAAQGAGAASPAAPPSPTEQVPAGAPTIRVSVDVLENLMTLVSELVLTRNQLLQLARVHEQNLGDFAAPLQRLSHITSDLQEATVKTRMQPIGIAWSKLPRLVRDLSRELGKKIELTMIGADTELDRQVLEVIRDPLTHMVRNSADHGLETQERRRAAGKSEAGRITLNAYHEGGHIIIEVSDDGGGLPSDRIRARILSAGLASAADVAAMTDEQRNQFIFHPGFSTADVVTAVSGRGVGMDVVKTNVERIGGTIAVRSEAGKGTTFTIKIPLTLAIVSALILGTAGERFAVPQISVVELVRASARGTVSEAAGQLPQIEWIDGTAVLRLRNRLLSLVRLDRLLGLNETTDEAGEATIVVIRAAGLEVGLIVDCVLDTEEIVVKPVAPILRHMSMFSGNTILGDGSVIMILDPNGIAQASGADADIDRPLVLASHSIPDKDGEVALLLFRAGRSRFLAVPLSLVARIESVPREQIETSSEGSVVQYRDRLMRVTSLPGTSDDTPMQSILVFVDGQACTGLLVDDILDVVHSNLSIDIPATEPGFLGVAIIAGRAADIVDTAYWLRQGGENWFRPQEVARPLSILVIEDSDFFRNMLVPVLRAASYSVTAVDDACKALTMRDGGACFDAIISDLEMPGLDGIGFARAVRADGAWSELPLIALSASIDANRVNQAREAGFTDYVGKFDREALLTTLHQCLNAPTGVLA